MIKGKFAKGGYVPDSSKGYFKGEIIIPFIAWIKCSLIYRSILINYRPSKN